ncbi:U6 small nuclear RNA (adenine-(43)-N(6))-methyltransferase-like isoform X2 [Anopheles albimanus]|uniref:U6 small nuclear RNA (adenine-(43)-N(6))-methyltransferase-like isoform X2 n=1 Tax=Anopheles albimanus TaxID=7167 RepID=UPI00163E7775|nr:U6 small nuclear RNA (adenine-(43)-N(6))-methyltransferase-like isoform X2 [Anopheles albimanus]
MMFTLRSKAGSARDLKIRRIQMSVNKFMHYRNRYREKPDYQELVKQFPELAKVATVDMKGNIKLDYKNKETVQLLTKCLLLKDFGLTLELPSNKLVPTLPLRLNYIHWLEDIGSVIDWMGSRKGIHGIDIGCGASCIYPLLAVVQSNRRWNMLAIEINELSLISARANVAANNLADYITVVPQPAEGSTLLINVLKDFPNKNFDFCMCNPPFYDSVASQEVCNRTGKRRKPTNAPTGSGEELCTPGGEVQFVGQLIRESLVLKDRISVYTTMIGHKQSYEEILRILKRNNIHNVTMSRLCQGNTTRWSVAWSYDVGVLLSRVHTMQKTIAGQNVLLPKCCKNQKPMGCRIFSEDEMPSISAVFEFLMKLFKSIAINLRMVKKYEKTSEIICEFIAYQNTWSHQRRKRRYDKLAASQMEDHPNVISGDSSKRLKLENHEHQPQNREIGDPYLRAAMYINHKESFGYFVSMEHIGGIAGRDGLNQVLQFIKNGIQLHKDLPITI